MKERKKRLKWNKKQGREFQDKKGVKRNRMIIDIIFRKLLVIIKLNNKSNQDHKS